MGQSVSILIPTHNRCSILLRALQSLREIQIPPDTTIELLVIANGCTDDTVNRVTEIAPTMPFPSRCVIEPNLSLNHARNRAIAEATGEIFAFLDDDVWVEKSWLVGLLEVFNSTPADIVAGPVILWWEAVAKPKWLNTRSEHILSSVHYGDKIIELHHAGLAIGANMAFRRAVSEDVGPFATGLDRVGHLPLSGGDTDFLSRALLKKHRMFYAPNAPIKHWVAPIRITHNYMKAAAFGNGLARPFFRPTLTFPSALWMTVQYGFRSAAYTLFEAAAFLTFCKGARIHHHIRRMTCWGHVVGIWRRRRNCTTHSAKKSVITPAAGSVL